MACNSCCSTKWLYLCLAFVHMNFAKQDLVNCFSNGISFSFKCLPIFPRLVKFSRSGRVQYNNLKTHPVSKRQHIYCLLFNYKMSNSPRLKQ